jgi:DNA-binding NarL/FixJ family response regulator
MTIAAAAKIGVGIVADNDVTSTALARVIAEDPELVIVGTASDVQQGLDLLRSETLDVLVVNLALSADGRRASGLQFIAEAKERRPDLNVLSLKRGVEEGHVRSAIDAGANACCLTGAPQERLVRAIKAVSVGGTWLDPELSELVFRSRNARIESTPRLTQRERAVLQLITEGYSNAAIAKHLTCSSGTVHTHVLNLFEKLGVHDRTSAAVFAIRNGLIFDNVL